ncbi:MAG: threonine--tRNA ligase, partial [Chitinophagaceae bacterium]|nr:threonine--tRNA ligase [Chitinophagaceae bacterium]
FEIDDRQEKIGKKIRDTELMKIPYMLIVGEKEQNDGLVSVRRQGMGDAGSETLDVFTQRIRQEVENREG